jgi:hypothetical protein
MGPPLKAASISSTSPHRRPRREAVVALGEALRRARRSRVGQGLGGQALASVGRCIAVRIFLAMSSVFMSAIRRSGAWHFEQTVSIPKTLRHPLSNKPRCSQSKLL